MAVETKRGCGYRKVGGLYLIGGLIAIGCDRLPLALETCPVCGGGIHFTRSITEINAFRLFGNHDYDPADDDEVETGITPAVHQLIKVTCRDKIRPCLVCDPADDVAFIMMVGARHYPTTTDFLAEARSMGISKRIPFIPKKLELGKTVVFLAHPKAMQVRKPEQTPNGDPNNPPLLEADENEYKLSIFCAFVPRAIEMPVWESQLDADKREKLSERGITPIPIPDGDKDHE